VNNALSKACHANGERDRKLPGTIIEKDKIDTNEFAFMEGELSFQQEVNIYRSREIKDAAVQILIETAVAWKMIENDLYAAYCLKAACYIGNETYFAEEDIEKSIITAFESRMVRRKNSKMIWERVRSERSNDWQ
jgi:hypothetical protein